MTSKTKESQSDGANIESGFASRLRSNDESVIEAILRDFGPTVSAGLRRKFSRLNSQDIEDILSISIMKLWTHRHKFLKKQPLKVLPLFMTIAMNCATDFLRQQKRRGPELLTATERLEEEVDPETLDNEEVDSEAVANEVEEDYRTLLREFVSKFSQLDRSLLQYYADHSDEPHWAKDASELFEMQPGAIRVRLSRIREKLRTVFLRFQDKAQTNKVNPTPHDRRESMKPIKGIETSLDELIKTNPELAVKLDALFFESVKTMVALIGYDRAMQALTKAVNDSIESTDGQLHSLDGGFAKDIAALTKQYPGCSIRFHPKGTSIQMEILMKAPSIDAPIIEEFKTKATEAFNTHSKLKPLTLNIQTSVVKPEPE